MAMRVNYEKSQRERAIAEKKYLVTVSVNGKHLRDGSCTVQALADLKTARRYMKLAALLLRKRAGDTGKDSQS